MIRLHRRSLSPLSVRITFILILLLLLLQQQHHPFVHASPVSFPPAMSPSPTNQNQTQTQTAANRRETITYAIPSTTLTLTLILNNDAQPPLPYAAASALLTRAAAHVRVNCTAAALVPHVFRYDRTDPGAEFGIAGGVYANTLSWRDVADALAGLQAFYAGRWGPRGEMRERAAVGLTFYLEDQAGRGEFADGYLEPAGAGGAGAGVEVEVDGGGAEGEGQGQGQGPTE